MSGEQCSPLIKLTCGVRVSGPKEAKSEDQIPGCHRHQTAHNEVSRDQSLSTALGHVFGRLDSRDPWFQQRRLQPLGLRTHCCRGLSSGGSAKGTISLLHMTYVSSSSEYSMYPRPSQNAKVMTLLCVYRIPRVFLLSRANRT